MAEQYVQIPPTSTGLKMRLEENTVSGNLVEQEVVTLADSAGNLINATSNALNVSATFPSAQAVTVSSGTLTAVTAISNPLPAGTNVIGHVIADSGSTTAVTGNVTVVQPTGTNLHVVLDTTSTTAVTQATAANLNATVVGTGTFAVQNTPVVPTSGGASIYHAVSAGSTNAVNLKASAGQVYGWSIFNNAGYPVYIKLFNNTNTPPVPGTDTVVKTIGCQAGVSVEGSIEAGLPFSVGIGIAIVKGIADANSTAVLASDCVVDIYYK